MFLCTMSFHDTVTLIMPNFLLFRLYIERPYRGYRSESANLRLISSNGRAAADAQLISQVSLDDNRYDQKGPRLRQHPRR